VDRDRLPFHGRRKGRRIRAGRQRLLDELLPRLALARPEPGATLDPATLFAETVEAVWLEIGFGGGEHLAFQAAQNRRVGLLGCEVFVNGLASLLTQVEAAKLRNVRVFPDDARLLLPHLAEASIERVFVLFPDPWPKARHAERRFIQRATLDALARIMAEGAELRLASDDADHVAWLLQQILAHPEFAWCAERADDWRLRPADWPETRYEAKAWREGRPPAYLRFRRLPRGIR